MKKAAIYARVSTKDQSFEQQTKELRDYCMRKEYTIYKEYIDDGVSALKANRPAFQELLDDSAKRKIDIILVYKLDRFGRSLKELLNTLDSLREQGVDFISYSQREINTTTATGKLFFTQLAAFAEFERDLISERTKLKLQYLKSQGRRLGRPLKIDRVEVLRLRKEGLSMKKIAEILGCTRPAISMILKN